MLLHLDMDSLEIEEDYEFEFSSDEDDANTKVAAPGSPGFQQVIGVGILPQPPPPSSAPPPSPGRGTFPTTIQGAVTSTTPTTPPQNVTPNQNTSCVVASLQYTPSLKGSHHSKPAYQQGSTSSNVVMPLVAQSSSNAAAGTASQVQPNSSQVQPSSSQVQPNSPQVLPNASQVLPSSSPVPSHPAVQASSTSNHSQGGAQGFSAASGGCNVKPKGSSRPAAEVVFDHQARTSHESMGRQASSIYKPETSDEKIRSILSGGMGGSFGKVDCTGGKTIGSGGALNKIGVESNIAVGGAGRAMSSNRMGSYPSFQFTGSSDRVVCDIDRAQAQLSENVRALQDKIKERDEAIRRLETHRKTLDSKVKEREKTVHEMEKNNKSIASDYQRSKQELECKLDECESNYASMKCETNKVIRELNSKIVDLQNKVDNDREEMNHKDDVNEYPYEDTISPDEQIKMLLKEVQELESVNQQNSDQIKGLGQKLGQVEKKIGVKLSGSESELQEQKVKDATSKAIGLKLSTCAQNTHKTPEEALEFERNIKDNIISYLYEELKKFDEQDTTKTVHWDTQAGDYPDNTSATDNQREIDQLNRCLGVEARKAQESEQRARQAEDELRRLRGGSGKQGVSNTSRQSLYRPQNSTYYSSTRRNYQDEPYQAQNALNKLQQQNCDPSVRQTVATFGLFNQLLTNVINLANARAAHSSSSGAAGSARVANEIHALTHVVTAMAAKNIPQKCEVPALQTHYDMLYHNLRTDYDHRLRRLESKLRDMK